MNSNIPWGNNFGMFFMGSVAFTIPDPGWKVAETMAEEEQKEKCCSFVFLT